MGRLALALLVALGTLVLLFDWNWFRPALQHYLTEKSRRNVKIDDLQVSFGPSLVPTVRLRGVEVQNSPWASPQPFAVAAEAAFTFGWKSIFDRQPVITRLVLRDAEVDMERQADGLRNWRLTRPDDRGPPRMRVLALEAHNSKIRFIHHGLGLELNAAASPASAPSGGLSNVIDFSGSYRGTAFEGQTLAGPLLTFQRTGVPFPLLGHVVSGKTRLELEGTVTDLQELAGIDADVRLNGASLAQLHPFMPGALPATHAYRASGHLKKADTALDITQLQATLGESDATGELHYREVDDRPSVRASLQSRRLTLADLMPASTAKAKPTSKTDKLPFAQLDALDGELELRVNQLKLPPGAPELQHLKLAAHLQRGVLTVTPLALGLGGGQLSGQLTLDGHAQPPTGHAELRLHGARLERLLPDLPEKSRVEGLLAGHAKLQGHGDTIAAWAASTSGSVNVTMDKGSIANKLDAKLGLNGGKLLRAMVSGTEQIAAHCGAVQLDLQHGQGHTRALVLDTEQTHVDGSGVLSLRDETFELLLVPQPKKRSLLALHSAIRVSGSLQGTDFKLVKRPDDMPASSCQAADANAAAGVAVAPSEAKS